MCEETVFFFVLYSTSFLFSVYFSVWNNSYTAFEIDLWQNHDENIIKKNVSLCSCKWESILWPRTFIVYDIFHVHKCIFPWNSTFFSANTHIHTQYKAHENKFFYLFDMKLNKFFTILVNISTLNFISLEVSLITQ